MTGKLIWSDIKQNKLSSVMTVFFMALSAMLAALTVLLFSGLVRAIDGLMDEAQVPDYMQMHTRDQSCAESGADSWEAEAAEIARFAESHKEIYKWQICRFMNLDNNMISLGGVFLADSTQDNGLSVQGKGFDYLLDMENKAPEVMPGEVYVPVCYRARYDLAPGDIMTIKNAAQTGERRFVIAGFLRDAQMNSMMASSKRFLISEADYENMAVQEDSGLQEEYLIEFLLREGTDIVAFAEAYTAAHLPANGPAITKPLVRMMNALSDGTMIFIIFLVSIVVLLISVLCICFMLSLQMERDRKEVGMLKALGIGRAQIRRIYYAKYLLFSAAGALTGGVAASGLKRPLEGQIRELYGAPGGGWQTSILAVLTIVFTEGIIMISIWHSLRKTDKLSAVKMLFLAREQEEKPQRRQYVLIGFTAFACTFLPLVPQNLYNTMSDSAFVTYMGIGDAEIRMDVRQAEGIERKTQEIAASLEKDAQVEKYAVLRTKSCKAVLDDGRSVSLLVETGDHGIFPVSFSEGRAPEREWEIALSVMNAEELGVSVGDSLGMEVLGIEADYMVCGVYSDITNGGKTAKAYCIEDDSPVIWSVLYVSLKDSVVKERWAEEYRQMRTDVTDMEHYVKDTYSQTRGELGQAVRVTLGASTAVIMAVGMLFMRLLVEKNRYSISLHKALGFRSRNLKYIYFIKGMRPVIAGVAAGMLAGNVGGEQLCQMMMKSFGVNSFFFVTNPSKTLLVLFLVLVTAGVAVQMGIADIKKIKAYECCKGQE